jgi:hypothetical protein
LVGNLILSKFEKKPKIRYDSHVANSSLGEG